MMRALTTATALALALSSAVFAETHEVKMLNKSDAGKMVFEPDFLRVAPGDTVKFLASTRGHNAEADKSFWPEGAERFAGKINEEIEVSFDTEGLYGIICKPHYAMGMVMTVAVGDMTEAPEDALEGRIPRKAKKRYEAQLEKLAE